MIVWTDYFKYRAGLRGFDLTEVEKILSFSDERYIDTATGRNVVVGKHGRLLTLIPSRVPATILHLLRYTRRRDNRLTSG